MKEERTNVLRILDKLKIDYVVHSFDVDPENYVGIDEERAPVKVGLRRYADGRQGADRSPCSDGS